MPLPPEIEDRAAELYRDGVGLVELDRRLGYPYTTIRKALHARGDVEVRRRGRPRIGRPPGLGTLSDREIARRDGRSWEAVRRQRQRLSVPSPHSANNVAGIEDG